MNITDWLYHHKILLITIIILLFGGISGIFVLVKDNPEVEEMLSDISVEEKEIVEKTSPILEEEKKSEEKPKTLKVDVKGAIANPRVYEVEEGKRIFELIELAGGTTKNAYTKNINLSKKVQDEMVIYIYTEEEYTKKTTCSVKNEFAGEITKEIEKKESIILEEEKAAINQKINLNTASKEILMNVPNIGEKKADSIIEYRTQNGLFTKVEELKEISGIGNSVYEKVKDYFTI